jgi:hypothetical protein
MASERGYDVRTAPSAGPGPVLSDPRDFGAQVGAALEQFGQAKHSADVRAYQIERQQNAASEQASFASNFAKYRQSMDGVVLQTRGNAAPGAAGHPDSIKTVYEAGRDALLSGITEDRLRQQASAQFDEYGASLLSRESVWAEGKRVAKLVTDTGDLIDTGANRIRSARDQAAYADELRHGQDAIAAMQGIDDDTKAKLQRQMQQSYSVSFVQGLFDSGQAKTAKGLIESGAFNDVLEPKQIEALTNGADVEMRRDQALIEHQQAQQKAALNEAIATAKVAMDAGQYVEPATLSTLRDQAAALGDTSTAQDLDNRIAENGFAKIYQGAPPNQIEARRAALAGKGNTTPAEQRELAWLQSKGDALISQANDDTVGYAMKYGRGPAAIDWNDPATVQARVSWSRTEAEATGRPVAVLSRVEAEQLHETMAAGQKGRLQVLQQLDALPPVERMTAARQVAPQDVSFQHEAQIAPAFRATVYNGRERLVADRAFLNPDKKTAEGLNAQQLLGIAGSELDFALKAVSPADAAAVKDIAGSYLAGVLSAKARSVNSLTPTDIREAATVALGGKPLGRGQLGGIGHWAGGEAFIVPDGFTQDGFAMAAWRDKSAKAAKGMGPINPDGTPFDLNNAYPVYVGGGSYRWETRSGTIVKRKDGRPYLSEVAAGK